MGGGYATFGRRTHCAIPRGVSGFLDSHTSSCSNQPWSTLPRKSGRQSPRPPSTRYPVYRPNHNRRLRLGTAKPDPRGGSTISVRIKEIATPMVVETLPGDLYRVTSPSPLAPGEYALVSAMIFIETCAPPLKWTCQTEDPDL